MRSHAIHNTSVGRQLPQKSAGACLPNEQVATVSTGPDSRPAAKKSYFLGAGLLVVAPFVALDGIQLHAAIAESTCRFLWKILRCTATCAALHGLVHVKHQNVPTPVVYKQSPPIRSPGHTRDANVRASRPGRAPFSSVPPCHHRLRRVQRNNRRSTRCRGSECLPTEGERPDVVNPQIRIGAAHGQRDTVPRIQLDTGQANAAGVDGNPVLRLPQIEMSNQAVAESDQADRRAAVKEGDLGSHVVTHVWLE
mmetsp:Transcript_61310/g.99264  ORF Transcript_61310/g.99264 Transcript_61310/m.99264 type:complete len:252 (-) Transcript_61310:9-764(-)